MITTRVQFIALLLSMIVVSGCQSAESDDELSGRITLWHSWSPAETVILDQELAQFQEVHPKVRITSLRLSEDQILSEFYRASDGGLGPGVMIGKNEWIRELADSGMIRPFPMEDIPSTPLNSRGIASVRYQDQLYGLPLALAPHALLYNKNLVSNPPTTLDALLEEAAENNQIAFVPRFEDAFWGIQAFGEGLFDDDGRFTLDESGFTEWLRWLNEAQSAPGVILNVDEASLLNLFASEQIAYYIAAPDEVERISSLMGQENRFELGVAPLPSGPYGPAGPLIPTETILLYTFAAPEQIRIANSLALFLTNQQQAITFVRELGKVSANPRVRVDRRIYPVVGGFAEQAKTAVVLPNEIPRDLLFEAGNRAYVNVRAGTLTPEEAVCQFGKEVANIQQYAAEEMSLPDGCEVSADLPK